MLGLRIRIFTIIIASVAPLASADEPLRLADVLAEAERQNPAIEAARERATAASFRPDQAVAYDDPMLSWESWNTPESFAVERADNNIFKLSQKIPFPGKRTTAGKAAEQDADRARAQSVATQLEVAAMVKRAYYALWQSHQNVHVYTRDKELALRFATIAEQRYAVGQVSQPDVLRAQVEVTRLANRVITERLAIDGARAELNALRGRPATDPLGVPQDPDPPRLPESEAPLVERAIASRPEIAAQAALVESEKAKLRLARLDYLPDFEVSVSRFVNHESRDGFGAMAGVSLPFLNKRKYDAAVDEARARLASAEAGRRRIADRVSREVTQAFLRARSAMLRRELFVTTHIPLAEQGLAASEIAYQTGKIDFLSLIDSVRAIEEAHLEHIEAEADFEKAFADLERAVGEPIERGEVR